MNRIARRSLILLGTGTAVVAAALLGAGVGGAAQAGKGVTAVETSVAGTNWDRTPVGAGWAGPTWAGPTWAGPTAAEV
ncbi:hypothetical protein [Paractinoplanes brasiliensis]|uniref:hypothetical protein n=1 Tax=Paractinoplanes brasiliensis TaxID=52695 RepID=UPI00105F35CE|nr:hypothetical protein [Actinoplanes brasiliensis]